MLTNLQIANSPASNNVRAFDIIAKDSKASWKIKIIKIT
jgi:hypothetical protein